MGPIIVDSEKAYQPNLEESEKKYDIHILISMMINQVKVTIKKRDHIAQWSRYFILNKRIDDLLSWELSMPVRFDSNVRPFCFYHRDDFNALQEEEKKRILPSFE